MLKQLSASKLDCYLLCPLRFSLRYLDLIEPEEISVPLVFGSAVHGTIKHMYRKLMAGQRMSIEEAEKSFVQDWEAQCTVPVKWNGTTPEQLQDQGVALVRAYLEAVPDPVIPVAVEQELRAPIVNLITGETIPGIELHGILDRIEPGNRPIELKTSSQSYSQFRTDISLQFSIYSYLLAYLNQTEEIEGDFEVLVKLKTPRMQRLTTRRNVRDFDRLFRTIKHVLQGIDSGVFYTNPSHMYCTG
ncbi:MAG: PD-(D/E)XK nuclease family protein [bacterium]